MNRNHQEFDRETIANLTGYIYSVIAGVKKGIRLHTIFQDWKGTYSDCDIVSALRNLEETGRVKFEKGRFFPAAA